LGNNISSHGLDFYIYGLSHHFIFFGENPMSIKRPIFILLLITFATSIRAETINCTPITSVPATITAQGIYCLTGNLSTSQSTGNAITINANNVTLDLNGWKLGGQGAGLGTQAYGIYSTANNVTIKNGIARGFFVGIYLSGSGAVVQDMLVDSNTRIGIYSNGTGALVEHNQVVNTGGTTIYGADANAFGLIAYGSGSNVNNNMVSGVIATGNGDEWGIDIESGANTTARNNVVSNTAIPNGATSFGIYLLNGVAVNNTVSNFTYGIYTYTAAIYTFNTVFSCTTDFSGGTNGAGNSGT
jgi:hypothetical protein